MTQLWPATGRQLRLRGLYLEAPLLPAGWPDRIFVYSNFVASTDGRIAVPAGHGLSRVPDTIANPRDWRLFQELAAHADILLTSGGYLREFAAGLAQDALPLSRAPAYADLGDWRRARGWPAQPDVAVLSNRLDFELPPSWRADGRRVFILTARDPASAAGRRLAAAGAQLVRFAGDAVGGRAAIEFLAGQGYRRLYSIGGPLVLRSLLAEDVLDTLFLTRTHRLIGGSTAPTILEGEPLAHPVDLRLSSLYFDPAAHDGLGQLLARYDRASAAR